MEYGARALAGPGRDGEDQAVDGHGNTGVFGGDAFDEEGVGTVAGDAQGAIARADPGDADVRDSAERFGLRRFCRAHALHDRFADLEVRDARGGELLAFGDGALWGRKLSRFAELRGF